MAEIDDDQILAVVALLFELLGSNARDAKFAEKFAAGQPFLDDPGGQSGQKQNGQTAAEAGGVLGDDLDLFAEDVSRSENAQAPEHGPESVEEQELAGPHVKDSGQRRSDGAESRDEFGNQQGTRALFGEDAFGTAHAGVGLQGNLAEKLQDAYAFDLPQRIPQGVGGQRGQSNQSQAGPEAEAPGAGERAGGQQHRQRRGGNPQLLGKNPGEHNDVAVLDKKFDGSVHRAGVGPRSAKMPKTTGAAPKSKRRAGCVQSKSPETQS